MDAQAILTKIVALQNDLQGDVKKLTNFLPKYRLRVGSYRVLFNLEALVHDKISHKKIGLSTKTSHIWVLTPKI